MYVVDREPPPHLKGTVVDGAVLGQPRVRFPHHVGGVHGQAGQTRLHRQHRAAVLLPHLQDMVPVGVTEEEEEEEGEYRASQNQIEKKKGRKKK
jgi:hypothetical protein